MSELSDELFARTQELLAGLDRHRRSVRNETPLERTTRQRHRAEACARALGSTKPAVVKAIFNLVVADELPAPQGDPVPPVAPGARAALKPKKKTGVRKSNTGNTTHTECPGQETLW